MDIIQKGNNYGWRNREGAHDNVTSTPPAFLPLVDPIFEYSHSTGAAFRDPAERIWDDLAPGSGFPIAVDDAAPGAFSGNSALVGGVIAAGTSVDSYLFHSDTASGEPEKNSRGFQPPSNLSSGCCGGLTSNR